VGAEPSVPPSEFKSGSILQKAGPSSYILVQLTVLIWVRERMHTFQAAGHDSRAACDGASPQPRIEGLPDS
jgi:hypothetical protein